MHACEVLPLISRLIFKDPVSAIRVVNRFAMLDSMTTLRTTLILIESFR